MTGVLTLPGRYIARFLRWWGGELLALVPRRLRNWVAPRPDDLIVELGSSDVHFYRIQGGNVTDLGQAPLDAANPVLAAGAGGAKSRRGRQTVTLVLPAGSAASQQVTLPLAAEENLREVIGFELDRLTPFKPEEVYFDHSVVDRDPVTQTLRVALTVCPRASVDAVTGQATDWGLDVSRVDQATEEPGRPSGLNLLPHVEAPASSRLARFLTVVLLLSAAALGGFSVQVPLERKARQAEALLAEVATVKANAAKIRQMRGEMKAIKESGLYVANLKRDRRKITRLLDTMTRLLPDDTWLYQMRINDDKLEMAGFAPNSSALIGIFEASPAFTEARFRAPVTQDRRLEMDRFSIQVRLVAEEAEE